MCLSQLHILHILEGEWSRGKALAFHAEGLRYDTCKVHCQLLHMPFPSLPFPSPHFPFLPTFCRSQNFVTGPPKCETILLHLPGMQRLGWSMTIYNR